MKIFSKIKWKARAIALGYTEDEIDMCCSTWVDECDGKEVTMYDDGFYFCCDEYIIHPEWCEEDGDHIPRIN